MKKVFNWLVDKWLAGFITGSIFFTAKLYSDLPATSRGNFFRFNWISDLIHKQVSFSVLLMVVIAIILLTRVEKVILKSKLTQKDSSLPRKQAPAFDKYRKDVFGVNKTTWVWNYDYNDYDSTVQIIDLKPICKRCGTTMDIANSYHSDYAECHKCRLDGRPNYDRLTENISDVHKEIVRKITNNEYNVSQL